MINRLIAALVAVALACLPFAPGAVLAANPMSYDLMTQQQATQLPRGGGVLGMEVGPAQHMNDSGLSFELLRVKVVRPGSAGAAAHFATGDLIIAVDNHVFPNVATFAAYVGSMRPGQQFQVDYIPKGGGPQQAQRIQVMAGAKGQTITAEKSGGLSTGTKVAIGVGAAALFTCYKLGCFSRLMGKTATPQQPASRQPIPEQAGAPQPAPTPQPDDTLQPDAVPQPAGAPQQ